MDAEECPEGPPRDYVGSFGALTLDHRFKRIMERLLEEARQVYDQLGLPFRPRWQSSFVLIAREGPVGVTEIAEHVRLTHPAIIKITDGLLKAGLVRQSRDRRDARRRVFALSAKGRRLLPELEQVWADLARAQLDAFEAAGWPDVLGLFDALEQELEARPVVQRVLNPSSPRAEKPRRAPVRNGAKP